MKRIFLIIIFLLSTNNLFANTLEYKGLEKLSKNNTFMNNKGEPYSIDEISDKKNSVVIVYNHGSIQDHKQDPCKAKPKFGYLWDAAVVPAILKLHNKTINGLEVKIYRVCSGVKGMSVKNQKKYRKELNSKGKIDLVDEHKIIKRTKIILNEVENLKKLGFDKIILSGYSAGGWSSLVLQSRHPEKIIGTIAFNPAFAGPKKEWQKKYPEWGAFRDDSINKLNKADKINAIVFAHKDDIFEDPKTLSFFENFKDLSLIDYSEIKPTSCTWADVNEKMTPDKGHNIPQSKCFTKYLEDKNYLTTFLENIL
jgi:dienelactone hydrolase